MLSTAPSLEELWTAADFNPNPQQRKAIEYIGRPLFLTSGPGKGTAKGV